MNGSGDILWINFHKQLIKTSNNQSHTIATASHIQAANGALSYTIAGNTQKALQTIMKVCAVP